MTAKGKVAFQIPSDLSANLSRGKTIVKSYCSCHEERIGYNYTRIDAAIRLSPMLFDESQISRAQRADIVAYLNRFTP